MLSSAGTLPGRAAEHDAPEASRPGSKGDHGAKGRYEQAKRRQRALAAEKEAQLDVLLREPTLIVPGEVTFLAHALAMPSSDPEDQRSYQRETERVAMQEAIAYEETLGARVVEVHTPHLARQARLEDNPGFDLLSYRRDGEARAIEDKGRAPTSAAVDLEENAWVKACTLQDGHWLYAHYGWALPRS